jgi:hypothetical protein
MSNYFPAIPSTPTNTNYSIALDTFRSFSAKVKRLGREEINKSLAFDGHSFMVVVAQFELEDVKTTQFNRFLVDAVQYMEAHAPNELVQQALPYLHALNEKTNAYDALALPPLSVSLPEDREMLVEWNFGHFTIGLSFETNAEESSWYIVHDRTVNKMTGWGYLKSQTIESLVNTILGQVVVYAP